ncbi:MAG: TlpA family protein disulfide reductase [Flavobacterium sp.]|nr:TlpA family protein disulfide reductase [Flavobacterium sp.]
MKNILTGSYLILIYILLGVITWGEHYYILPLMLALTFIVSILVFKINPTNDNLKKGMILTFPFTLILLSSCLWYSDFSRGLPYILFVPLSSYFAFLYVKYKNIYIIILSAAFFAFICFFVFPNYFIYYHNHNAEKNSLFNSIDLLNDQKKPFNISNDKIVVLDFWTTSCGICFKKFPDLEIEYQKYKLNKNVKIYAVNVPIKGDKFDDTIKILDSIGYTFPKLYAKSFQQIETNLKFNTFPHLLIIKDGRIRYDGFLITSEESRLYNIDDEIEKLLK